MSPSVYFGIGNVFISSSAHKYAQTRCKYFIFSRISWLAEDGERIGKLLLGLHLLVVYNRLAVVEGAAGVAVSRAHTNTQWWLTSASDLASLCLVSFFWLNLQNLLSVCEINLTGVVGLWLTWHWDLWLLHDPPTNHHQPPPQLNGWIPTTWTMTATRPSMTCWSSPAYRPGGSQSIATINMSSSRWTSAPPFKEIPSLNKHSTPLPQLTFTISFSV